MILLETFLEITGPYYALSPDREPSRDFLKAMCHECNVAGYSEQEIKDAIDILKKSSKAPRRLFGAMAEIIEARRGDAADFGMEPQKNIKYDMEKDGLLGYRNWQLVDRACGLADSVSGEFGDYQEAARYYLVGQGSEYYDMIMDAYHKGNNSELYQWVWDWFKANIKRMRRELQVLFGHREPDSQDELLTIMKRANATAL